MATSSKHTDAKVPVRFPERTKAGKYEFAARLQGTLVDSKVAPGQKSKVTNYYATKNGRGVFLVLEDGSRVYRECPSVKGARS